LKEKNKTKVTHRHTDQKNSETQMSPPTPSLSSDQMSFPQAGNQASNQSIRPSQKKKGKKTKLELSNMIVGN
jgi:hypothetical protein